MQKDEEHLILRLTVHFYLFYGTIRKSESRCIDEYTGINKNLQSISRYKSKG